MHDAVRSALADVVDDDDVLAALGHGDGHARRLSGEEAVAFHIPLLSGVIAVLGDAVHALLIDVQGCLNAHVGLGLIVVVDHLYVQHLAGKILLIHEDDVVPALLQGDGVGGSQLLAVIAALNQLIAVRLGIGGNAGGDVALTLSGSRLRGGDQLAVPGVQVVDVRDGVLGQNTVVDDLLVVEVHHDVTENGDVNDGGQSLNAVHQSGNQLKAVVDGLSLHQLALVLDHRSAQHGVLAVGGSAVDGDGSGLVVVVDGNSTGLQGDILLVDEGPDVLALSQIVDDGGVGGQRREPLLLARGDLDALTDIAAAADGLAQLNGGCVPVTGHTGLVHGHGVGVILIVDLIRGAHQIGNFALIVDDDGSVGAGLEDHGQGLVAGDALILIAVVLGLCLSGKLVTGQQLGILLGLGTVVNGHGINLTVNDGLQIGGVVVDDVDVGVAALVVLRVTIIVQVDHVLVAHDDDGVALALVEGVALAPAELGSGVLLIDVQAIDLNTLNAVIQSLAGVDLAADDHRDDLAGHRINDALRLFHSNVGVGAPVVVDDDAGLLGSHDQIIVQVDDHVSGQFVDVQLGSVAGVRVVLIAVIVIDLNSSKGLSLVSIPILNILTFGLVDNDLAVHDGGHALAVVVIDDDLDILALVNDQLIVQGTDVVGGILSHDESQGAVRLDQSLVIAQLLIEFEALIAGQRSGIHIEHGGGANGGGLLGSLSHRGLLVQDVLAALDLIGVGGVNMIDAGTGDDTLIVQTGVVQVDHVAVGQGSHDLDGGLHPLQLVLSAAKDRLGLSGVVAGDLDVLHVGLIGGLGIGTEHFLAGGQDAVGLIVVVDGNGDHDVVVVQTDDIVTVGNDLHLGLAGDEGVILLGVLGGVTLGSGDGTPHLHRAVGSGIVQNVGLIIVGLGITLQVVLDLPVDFGDLTAHTGDMEGYLLDAGLGGNAQVGVLVGGIVFVLLKTLGCGIQGDGVGDLIGIGGHIAGDLLLRVGGIQIPDDGAAVGAHALAAQTGHIAQHNVLAHGVSDLGAAAVHALGGGLGNIGEGCADGNAVSAHEDVVLAADDVAQILLIHAVTHSVDGALLRNSLSHCLGPVGTGGGGIGAGGRAAGESDGGGAAALRADAVGEAVTEQDGELGTGIGHRVHIQTVAGQHQTGVHVGGVIGCAQVFDGLLHAVQVGHFLDVHPVVLGGSTLTVGDHRHIDLTGVGGSQRIQEAVVLGQDLLDGLQTGIGVVSVVAGCAETAAGLLAAGGTVLHGGRGVDDQLNGGVAGGHRLRGNGLQSNIEGVLAGLLDGLADPEAQLLMDFFIGGADHFMVFAELIPAVHGLILIAGCEGRQLQHTEGHDQSQEHGQTSLAQVFEFSLCHHFVLLSNLRGSKYWQPLRHGLSALASLLCVPPFRCGLPFAVISWLIPCLI